MSVIQMIAVKLTDEDYEILELILTNQSKIKQNLDRVLQLIVDHEYFELTDPWREFLSFEPKLEIQKVWTEVKRLPPERYIGVGYNDHGTLSTAPSWKEQLTDDGEVSTTASLLKFHLEFLLTSPLSRNPSYLGNFRLTSSRRAK